MKWSGIVLLLGIAWYVYAINAQTDDVEAFCSRFEPGQAAPDPEPIALEYSGTLMGPAMPKPRAGKYSFVYCAPLTMCDVSCSVEVENGLISKSDFYKL